MEVELRVMSELGARAELGTEAELWRARVVLGAEVELRWWLSSGESRVGGVPATAEL